MSNRLQPTGDQLRRFRDETSGAPVFMLNLLKFREKAAYGDERDRTMTGREAYALYSKAMEDIVPSLGGSFVFSGPVHGLLIGEMGDLWDAAAIVQYPSAAKMLEMMQLPEYGEAHVHREAGLEGQLLIECGKGHGLGQ